MAISTVTTPVDITTTQTLTPGAGATLRNGLTGQSATFVSGSRTLLDVEDAATGNTRRSRSTFNGLRFTVGGVNYLAEGFYERVISPTGVTSGSGEVVLTSDGVRIGRLFYDANGVLQIEVDGVVQPFGVPRSNAGARASVRGLSVRGRLPAT